MMTRINNYTKGYNDGVQRGREQLYNETKSKIGLLEKKVEELKIVQIIANAIAMNSEALANLVTRVK